MSLTTPGAVGGIDQAYAEGRSRITEMAALTRPLLRDHGPALTAALIGTDYLAGWDDLDMLKGLTAVAIVELARREVGPS